MSETKEITTLADALPAEIKRVQEKRERWLEFARIAGPQANFKPALMLMQMSVDEGVQALASGDVVRMLRAHEALKDHSDDD